MKMREGINAQGKAMKVLLAGVVFCAGGWSVYAQAPQPVKVEKIQVSQPQQIKQANPSQTSATPQTQQENPNAPQIVFDHEEWDFGEVPEGPKVSHDFWFTNKGKEPLVLYNVRASCGCTTPYWPREPIPPGERAKITVEYNTAGRPGPFTKTVVINSNAATPTKVIRIKGVVVRQQTETSPLREPIVKPQPAQKED